MLSKWQICKKQKSDKLNILSTVELWYNKLCSEFPRNFIEYEWLWHSEWSALKLTSSQQNASRTSPRILGVIFFNLLITLPFDRSSGNLSKVYYFPWIIKFTFSGLWNRSFCSFIKYKQNCEWGHNNSARVSWQDHKPTHNALPEQIRLQDLDNILHTLTNLEKKS